VFARLPRETVAFVSALILCFAAVARGQTVSDVPQLLDAVANAQPGATITLAPGTYELSSSLQPTVPMTIRGSGAGTTVLRSAPSWQADFSTKPDDDTDFRTVDRGSYLVDLGSGVRNMTFEHMTLSGPTLHGGIYGDDADGIQLRNLELNDFGYSGVRLFRTADAVIRDNNFVDAGGRVANATGGAMFLTFFRDGNISGNRITKTGDRNLFGVKGRQFRDTRIHHNTIKTSFAVELPFENDSNVEIDHNFLGGTVSVPKFEGGPANPVGGSFRIHHNYANNSYAIEGPRNGLEIDHNLFDFDQADDRGNLITVFGSSSQNVQPGPISFHDNNVKNPGRGIFWSDLPHDELSFVRNHIIADETTPSQFPQGLFGFRPAKGDAETDFATIDILDNIIEVLGEARPLLRNDPSYDANIAGNILVNLSDLDRIDNPATGNAPGPDEVLRFRVGADGEYLVSGFDLIKLGILRDNAGGGNTAGPVLGGGALSAAIVPEPAMATLFASSVLLLCRRRV
ncbi:MAG: right-handed parallel beta-helix repeat-containing protein, partial [Planctomycetota bacterium]